MENDPSTPNIGLQIEPRQIRPVKFLAIIAVAVLALYPIARIISIVATTGANNLSNDYWRFTAIIDLVLDGKYDWRNYLRDTFWNGHSLALPVLVYLGVAKLAHWNVYVEMYIGIALFALRLALLHSAFTHPQQRLGWLLWLPLSALVFAVSQISVFTFGFLSIHMGLNQLGIALGVWGLTRFSGQWRAIGLMILGGAIATLSWSGGIMAWPVFLLGLLLLRFRRRSYYGVWLGASLLVSLPYPVFMVLRPSAAATKSATIVSLGNLPFIFNAIGRPFANGIGTNVGPMPLAEFSGMLGVLLSLIGILILWARYTTLLQAQSAPALMLISYGLLTIWQVSSFRSSVAPWYTTPAMTFWLGLLGLAYTLWVNRRDGHSADIWGYKAIYPMGRIWSVAVLGAIGLLYIPSNVSYEDKIFHLASRSPASASCLRNYRTAPTYCEGYLFQWGVGTPDIVSMLGQRLERHHLSVFSPRQQWALQGDFVLDTVRIGETPGIPDISWSSDLETVPAPWSSYKHLNLFLHTPNTIEWTVSLPPNATRADFHSAIAVSASAPRDSSADGILFEVYLQPEGKNRQLALSEHSKPNQCVWQSFSIPLSVYAGKTITLELTSDGGENLTGDWAMYRYPHIDLILDPLVPITESIVTQPSNTASLLRAHKLSASDFQFGITEPSLWQVENMEPAQLEDGRVNTWIVERDPYLQFAQPLSVRLSDYTQMYVRMALSPDIKRRALQIYYSLDSETTLRERQSLTIPLLADGQVHEYTYDLKLLELDQSSFLTGIRLDPVYEAAPSGTNWVQILDFRLIRRADNAESLLLTFGASPTN
jgi:hypothetical protein